MVLLRTAYDLNVFTVRERTQISFHMGNSTVLTLPIQIKYMRITEIFTNRVHKATKVHMSDETFFKYLFWRNSNTKICYSNPNLFFFFF